MSRPIRLGAYERVLLVTALRQEVYSVSVAGEFLSRRGIAFAGRAATVSNAGEDASVMRAAERTEQRLRGRGDGTAGAS